MQHFQQSHVHLRIFIPKFDGIRLFVNLADNIDRIQDQRCQAFFIRFIILVPTQKTQRQIQCIGAVFFHAVFCFAIQRQKHFLLRFLRAAGQQAFPLKRFFNRFRIRFLRTLCMIIKSGFCLQAG